MSTLKFPPAAKLLIAEAARKCFGYMPQVNRKTGFNVLRRMPYGNFVKSHVPFHPIKDFKSAAPGFTTDLEERRIEKLARLKRAGKPPPKKGAGKRASKKK